MAGKVPGKRKAAPTKVAPKVAAKTPLPVVAEAVPVAKPVEAKPMPVSAKPTSSVVAAAPAATPTRAATPAPVVVKAAAARPAAKPAPVERVAAKPISKPVAKVSAPAVKPAPAALPPAKKGMTIMATTIPTQPKAAAEKVKTMITDFNDRAKAAFEKGAKAGEELTEFTKGNMEALATSAKTAAKGAEALGQDLADYGKKSFETASATMKSLASVKTPTEAFQIQSDFAKSAFDSAFAQASKFSEAWLKLAGDVAQPLSSRYALAAEKFKSSAL